MKHSNSYQNSNQENEKVNGYLNLIKSDDYRESYPAVANYLQNKILNTKTKEKRNTFMEKFILSRKLKLALVVILLAVIGIACSMPVVQDDTLGYVVKWSAKKSNTEATDKINKLSWISKNQVSVLPDEILATNKDNNSRDELLNYSMVLQNTKEDVAKSYKSDLEKIPGVTNVQITPLTEKVKRSLFSTALNKIFQVEIDVSNMSDQEVEKNLREQFKTAGVQNIDLKVTRDEKGRRAITMKLSKDSHEGGDYDIKVKDGDKMLRMKKSEREEDAGNLMNKTDEEIRAQVRKDLDNPNIKDDEIEITRDKGNVNVNVNVKKEK